MNALIDEWYETPEGHTWLVMHQHYSQLAESGSQQQRAVACVRLDDLDEQLAYSVNRHYDEQDCT